MDDATVDWSNTVMVSLLLLISLPPVIADAGANENLPGLVGFKMKERVTDELTFPFIKDELDSWFGPPTTVKLVNEGGLRLVTDLALSSLNLTSTKSFFPIFVSLADAVNFTCPFDVCEKHNRRAKI